MVEIPIDEVATDAGTQTRAVVDLSTITKYAALYRSGAKLPPLLVYEVDGRYVLADGFHRIRGARQAGLTTLLSIVRVGSKNDAIRAGICANAINDEKSLPRVKADKTKGTTMYLVSLWEEGKDESDAIVAERCGITEKTAWSIRHRILMDRQIPRPPQTRLGKDGKQHAARKGSEARRSSVAASKRIEQIWTMTKEGMGPKEIAKRLGLAEDTVGRIRWKLRMLPRPSVNPLGEVTKLFVGATDRKETALLTLFEQWNAASNEQREALFVAVRRDRAITRQVLKCLQKTERSEETNET